MKIGPRRTLLLKDAKQKKKNKARLNLKCSLIKPNYSPFISHIVSMFKEENKGKKTPLEIGAGVL